MLSGAIVFGSISAGVFTKSAGGVGKVLDIVQLRVWEICDLLW